MCHIETRRLFLSLGPAHRLARLIADSAGFCRRAPPLHVHRAWLPAGVDRYGHGRAAARPLEGQVLGLLGRHVEIEIDRSPEAGLEIRGRCHVAMPESVVVPRFPARAGQDEIVYRVTLHVAGDVAETY